jgi:hypothetical protein
MRQSPLAEVWEALRQTLGLEIAKQIVGSSIRPRRTENECLDIVEEPAFSQNEEETIERLSTRAVEASSTLGRKGSKSTGYME